MAKKVPKKNKNIEAQSSKDRLIIMLLSIMLGTGLGFGLAQVASDELISTASAPTTTHGHTEKYEVREDDAPKVELVVIEDKKSGYNIKVIATDFTFTPEKVNGENVMGEGHAHLYVDGVKVARLYSPYFHWDGSFEGTKEFKVSLNANDHSEYAVGGETITATLPVTHDSESDEHDDSH